MLILTMHPAFFIPRRDGKLTVFSQIVSAENTFFWNWSAESIQGRTLLFSYRSTIQILLNAFK